MRKKWLDWWRSEKPHEKEFNYLYFGLILLFPIFLTFYHFLNGSAPLSGIPLFFLIYAIGQALLEVAVLAFLSLLLKRIAPRWVFYLLIAFSFVLQLLHFTDFTLIRLTDTSISFLLKFFFGSGIDHLLAASAALNLNPTMVVLIVLSILLIPAAGIFFYWATHQVAKKKPLRIHLSHVLIAIGATGALLFLLDLAAHPFLNRLVYSKYQKTLPFGSTFISPTQSCIALPQEIAPFRDEDAARENLASFTAPEKLPNLYLFVIETLRSDFVNAETAPHLSAFGSETLRLPRAFANGNSTHLSWFSIFHADFPYHWTHMRDAWKKGSIPIQVLKKLGYQIRIYSSADLRFFQMDRLLFGENRQLADQIEEYSLNRTLQPCERDALAFESFYRDIPEGRSGNAYIFFLDSTHSEYSIPESFPLKFKPIVKEIDYLSIGPMKPELEWIKNRYRNAISYIDSLFAPFFDRLKKEGLYDEAVIAITGDHGEEFFEEGALFHGTHLNSWQLSVPLFLKLPQAEQKLGPLRSAEATHMDLFPTLLHYLTGQSGFSPLFDGESLYAENRWPCRIAVHQNGIDTPCEFILRQGETEIRARFLNPKEIYSQSDLEIIDLKEPAPLCEGALESRIDAGLFEPLLIPR